MPVRVTRSASASAKNSTKAQLAGLSKRPGRRAYSHVIKEEGEKEDGHVKGSVQPSQRKARKRVKKEEGNGSSTPSPASKKRRGGGDEVKQEPLEDEEEKKPKTLAARKLQLHRSSVSKSPFPRWPAPIPEEAEQVAWLLGRRHGYKSESEGGRGLPRFTPPNGENKWGGCGDVKDVLDATVRTLLSCNTSGKNSSAAHASMTKRFGRNNWKAVLQAPQKELEDALRCGGLANTKSKNIQRLLSQTQERFGTLSLQHLHSLPDSEVLETLISFQGVGPKVASCVLAFCLGRPSMAVDTHVQRLSLSLGWVPSNSSREQTYYHLNDRIPPELRYPLHVLLISHGKACSNCRAKGGGSLKKNSNFKKGEGAEDSIVKKEGDERNEAPSSDEPEANDLNRFCPLKAKGLLGRKFKLHLEDDINKENF